MLQTHTHDRVSCFRVDCLVAKSNSGRFEGHEINYTEHTRKTYVLQNIHTTFGFLHVSTEIHI